MTKEQQDKAWASLPKETREDIRSSYLEMMNDPEGKITELFLAEIFGHHNLISNTEPEEILMVERKKIIELYANLTETYLQESIPLQVEASIGSRLTMLEELFGNKCFNEEI